MREKCTHCSSAPVVTIEQALQHRTAKDRLFYVNIINFISTFDLYSFFSLEKCLMMTGFCAVTIRLYVNAVLCLYASFKVKVKVTLVQALRLCTGRTAHRGSRGIALPFHDHGTRRGWGVSVTPRPLFTPGKTRYPLYRRLGGPQDQSGQVQKNSPPTGIRSPDRPARSQSLYRLSYPAGFMHFNSTWFAVMYTGELWY